MSIISIIDDRFLNKKGKPKRIAKWKYAKIMQEKTRDAIKKQKEETARIKKRNSIRNGIKKLSN